MEEGKLADYARRLHGLEEQLNSQARRLNEGLGRSQQDSVQELSSYDNHPADLGSEVFERSKDLALRETLRLRLEAVHEALEDIEAGTYGLCRRCGRPIDQERLKALPETTVCHECRQVMETGAGHRRRPIEEEVIAPPFGGFQGQRPVPEETGYDGEDSWQDVARYGSSDSISDSPGSNEYPNVYVNSEEDRGSIEEVEALPYYRDRKDGMLYEDLSGFDDDGPPLRR